MKIKTKKQLNLPQLIEWGFNNPELTKGRLYNIDDEEARFAPYVSFPPDGTGVRVPCTITHDDTFTVEVEEEITEDTKFRHIVFIDDCDLSASYENNSINDIKYGKDKEFHAYIDGKFKLIWRDGKLVE